jgi:MoaA/NifB/PqqE/SkfB family radical SAM enzyme
MDKFCPLPWIHLATRPNGDVRVCCTANASGAGEVDLKEVGLIMQDGNIMNLRDHSIEEVWNSSQMKTTRLQMLNGQIPASCNKCFEEESKGIVSKRQWETVVWKERLDIDSIVATTEEDGSLPVSIPYFDLRLGNLCQLKCIMCSPHDSSAWIKDWKIQYPKYKTFELKQDQHWDDRNRDYTWYQKGSFLDDMRDQANYIKELYFAGGEPLLIPEHYKILEFMVETGAAKNCVLRYNSNGLELPEKLFELWNHFKQVKFNFSIDAVGDKNYYIRYPSEWNTVVENLRRLDNTPDHIIVNIACAVQLLNVLYLPDLLEWKQQQNFKKISKEDGAGMIGLHLVYLPSYLNVRVLPAHLKELVTEKLTLFINNITDERFLTDPMGKQRWEGLIKYLNQEDWSSKLPALREYIEVCDRTRGLNFKETFPELTL